MIKHLIIGGGVGGVLTAVYLQKKLGVPSRNLRILDPHPTLLARWYANIQACGMKYLRSSSSHVLDTDFRSLRRFAAHSKRFDETDFTPPYRRPSVRLFQAHTESIMQQNTSAELHIGGSAQSMSRSSKGTLIVETDAGMLEAENLILSPGAGDQPFRPAWADSAPEIQHIYDPGFSVELECTTRRGTRTPHVVIVGGGIGAAQHACLLVRGYGAKVTIIARHEPTMSVFDFNPCYVGPSCLPAFLSTNDYGRRRTILKQERYPGTLPPDVYAEIQALRKSGSISWVRGEVSRVEQNHRREDQGCSAQNALQTTAYITPSQADRKAQPEMQVVCDELRLATGFTTNWTGNQFMRHITLEHNAPCEVSGVPIPDTTLEWVSKVFLVGRAAELEVGPPAGNIIGMHNAAKRICGKIAR
ncbi:MAG: FAD-dependent oxidoreductase [Spirochaetia bacterium]